VKLAAFVLAALLIATGATTRSDDPFADAECKRASGRCFISSVIKPEDLKRDPQARSIVTTDFRA
jgi:hypothetical protein